VLAVLDRDRERRIDRARAKRAAAAALDRDLPIWLAVLAFTVLCLLVRDAVPWISAYPPQWVPPIANAIDSFSTAASELISPVTRGFAWLMGFPMRGVQGVLQWIPWPVMFGLIGVIALRAGGPRLAMFALATLVYLIIAGYWRQSMNTLALVLLAVPMSVVAGFFLGVLAHRVPKLRSTVEVALDVMQTVPAFAYLIPLLLLFGFGRWSPDRQRDLCHPADGAQCHGGSRARAQRYRRIRHHERLHAAPALLDGRGPERDAADPGRHQPGRRCTPSASSSSPPSSAVSRISAGKSSPPCARPLSVRACSPAW